MTRYLLDTNIASHIIKGDIPKVRERLVRLPMEGVAISVVTQAELLYRVAKRGHPEGLSRRVQEFLLRVDVLPWTAQVGVAYAELRAVAEAGGVSLAPLDMMIAAHAHAMQAILVSRDRAFTRLPAKLGVEDWAA